MIRKSTWLLITLLILSLASTSLGSAQLGEPEVNTDIQYQFGSQMTITGTLSTSKPLARAVVFLRPGSKGETLVLSAEILPDLHPRLIASLDLSPPPFQPFERITYWWQVDFSDGASLSTPGLDFIYDDNRFEWQVMQDDSFQIHWIEGTDDRGRDLITLAQESLEEIRLSLGLLHPGQVSIYVYPTVGDLQSGLQIGGAPWVGAHSPPGLNVILLSAPDSSESMTIFERDIPHELTHILLDRRMGDQRANLPAWLSEGLSTLQERQPNAAYRFELENGIETDALISMESLCAAFPISDRDALLAYAQSASFVQYLLDVYGLGGIHLLLDAYSEGTSCTGGIQRVYQRPIEQLEREWKTLHLQTPTFLQRLLPILPWALVFVPVAVIVIVGISARRRHGAPPRNDE